MAHGYLDLSIISPSVIHTIVVSKRTYYYYGTQGNERDPTESNLLLWSSNTPDVNIKITKKVKIVKIIKLFSFFGTKQC